jgi:hypothetical protein
MSRLASANLNPYDSIMTRYKPNREIESQDVIKVDNNVNNAISGGMH